MMQTIPIDTFLASFDEYDLIIDARSPLEFGESHVPGATNFYALSDAEHAQVGTIYKQISSFEARLKGASFVCLNAARHIQELYPAYNPGSKIAIYCARGGMRSSSLWELSFPVSVIPSNGSSAGINRTVPLSPGILTIFQKLTF